MMPFIWYILHSIFFSNKILIPLSCHSQTAPDKITGLPARNYVQFKETVFSFQPLKEVSANANVTVVEKKILIRIGVVRADYERRNGVELHAAK